MSHRDAEAAAGQGLDAQTGKGDSVPAEALPNAKPSGRKGNRKVRTGCITCKIRKVKCDEAKPYCARCVSTGRKCDGYLPSKPAGSADARRKGKSQRPGPGASSSWLQALNRPPGLPQLEGEAARRAFAHYQSRSARAVGGSIDAEFWGGLVLRLSLSEPAVKHAVLALSSLHEHTTLRNREQGLTAFAYAEYGKAIAALRRWSPVSTWGHGDDSGAIPLLVCVLFVCIEFLLDDEPASQLHICQGRRILSRLDGQGVGARASSPAMQLIKQHLVPVYTRLSLASYLFGSKPRSIPACLRNHGDVPGGFTSLDGARACLYELLDDALELTMRARRAVYAPDQDGTKDLPNIYSARDALLAQLERWEAAFAVFVAASSPEQATAETISRHMLRIFFFSGKIWVAMVAETRELAYDAHMSSFAAIVSNASAVVNEWRAGRDGLEVFGFETGVLGPLSWVAGKCRHPVLRRAALRLLTSDELYYRKENLWYGAESAACAARVIQLEEGLDIPGSSGADTDGESSHGSPPAGIEFYADELKVPTAKAPTLVIAPLDYSEALPSPPAEAVAISIKQEAAVDGTRSLARHPSRRPNGPPPPPLDSAPKAFIAGSPVTMTKMTLDPPYGIPENRRMKNELIGPKQEGGTWLTLFRDPPDGGKEWLVTREFLKVDMSMAFTV